MQFSIIVVLLINKRKKKTKKKTYLFSSYFPGNSQKIANDIFNIVVLLDKILSYLNNINLTHCILNRLSHTIYWKSQFQF